MSGGVAWGQGDFNDAVLHFQGQWIEVVTAVIHARTGALKVEPVTKTANNLTILHLTKV